MARRIDERKNVGASTEIEGALIRGAQDGDVGPASDVVRAMVNQLGEDDERIRTESTWNARQRAIFDLAGKLGLELALRTLYEQPIAPEEGRATNGDGLQAQIVEMVDRGYLSPQEA